MTYIDVILLESTKRVYTYILPEYLSVNIGDYVIVPVREKTTFKLAEVIRSEKKRPANIEYKPILMKVNKQLVEEYMK